MNLSLKRINFLSLLVIGSISLTACETLDKIHLGPKLGIKIPLEEKTDQEPPKSSSASESATKKEVVFAQLDNSEEVKTNAQTMTKKTFIGSGRFIKQSPKKTAIQATGKGKGSVARTSESEERLVFRHNYPAKAINCL
jgi:general secretion pathway protein D